METTSFDDILKDEEKQQTPEPEPQPEAQAEEPDFEKDEKRSRRKAHQAKEFAAQGRDPDTGQFLQKEEPKQEAKPEPVKEQPKVELSEKERALLKAAEEERKKRQALEAELAQYRQRQPEKTEEKKTFWDDPEGHFNERERRMAQREMALTLKVSEQLARSKYKDFDEKVEEFAEALKTTPGLHAQWLASPDPGEFAYRHGALRKEMRDVGDLEKLKEKIEKETRTKLEAEFKTKQEELEKQRAALTPSLSDVKGAAKHAPVWTGPTPFEDILRGR